MPEKVNVEMNCTESKDGQVSCRISADRNGKKAECTLSVEEGKKGVSAKLSCTGDKEIFEEIQDSKIYWNRDGKDLQVR